MQPRRIASVDQFSCYGGGGIASLPTNMSLQTHEAHSVSSEPTRGPVRRCLSYDVIQSDPGRGDAQSEGSEPCPSGPPLCPPGSLGISWSSGCDDNPQSTSGDSSTSSCSGPPSPPSAQTQTVQPVMQGIFRMMDFAFETLNERTQRIQEIRDVVTRMQGTQADALQRLGEFRRLAVNNIECYLRRATEQWRSLSEHYRNLVDMIDHVDGDQRLGGIESNAVCQDDYNVIVIRAATLARMIEREVCSDTTSLGQLVNVLDGVQGELNTCQTFLPNFLQYVTRSMQRMENLQRVLNCCQADLDRFMVGWRNQQVRAPLTEPLLSKADLKNLTFQMSVSTEAPTPPTSPRRGSWSAAASPHVRALPRTPPCLPGRIQQWMRDASPSRLPPENIPYLHTLFTNYNQLEEQAINEVQTSNNERSSMNQSIEVLGSSRSTG